MASRRIGIREAKARISELLRDVRENREWTITDRGRPVARLVPVQSPATLANRIREMERAGVLRRPQRSGRRGLPRLLPVPVGRVQRMLQEVRSSE